MAGEIKHIIYALGDSVAGMVERTVRSSTISCCPARVRDQKSPILPVDDFVY